MNASMGRMFMSTIDQKCTWKMRILWKLWYQNSSKMQKYLKNSQKKKKKFLKNRKKIEKKLEKNKKKTLIIFSFLKGGEIITGKEEKIFLAGQ